MQFIEKPDYISWDDVQKCQHDAQLTNIKEQGIKMNCMDLSGIQLQQKCKGSKVFIAVDDDKVVGTGSILLGYSKKFGYNIKTAYQQFDSVHPNYRGLGLYHKIQEMRLKYAKENDVDVVFFDTHEKNFRMQKIYKKKGFHHLLLQASPTSTYYSVVMANHLKHPLIFACISQLIYPFSYLLTKIRFKPGRIKRFSI